MRTALISVFGGILGAILVACGTAGAQYAGILNLGPLFSVGADSTYTVGAVNGDIAYAPNSVGPTFAPGICGQGFRNTAERYLDPAWVARCFSYQWENDGNPQLRWEMVLNATGLAVGIQPEEPAPWPIDRFNVRGDMSLQALDANHSACTYTRVGPSMDIEWAAGRCPGLGLGTGDNYVLAKFKNGVWTLIHNDAY